MKNIFNHTKRPQTKWEEYEEENYDWDIEEDFRDCEEMDTEEEDAYYADALYDGDAPYDADAQYYEDVRYDEGAQYGAEPELSDDAPYIEQAPDHEILYTEEAEQEYAAFMPEDGGYAEDSDAAFYSGEDGTETEIYYTEENGAETEVYYAGEEEQDIYYAGGDEEEQDIYYAGEDEEEQDIYYAGEDEEEQEVYYVGEDEEEQDICYVGEDEEEQDIYYAGEDETEADSYAAYYADEDMETDADAYAYAYASPSPAKSRNGRKKAASSNRSVKGSALGILWNKFMEMDVMERIITSTGVVVLILALVTGSVYASAKMIDGQLEDFVSVGAQLADINVIGEKGLLAVADAERARLAAAEIVEEEEQSKEYNEAEYGKNVTVKLDLTSVLKDLKVKFTNQETGKLVANVPFSITVTDPSGNSEVWTDDDMDGVIYKMELKPGNYKVAMKELTDDKYKDYTISTEVKSVEVKKEIEYKKIDVSNEIKKESEIDASKEDTKKKDTVVESALKDTVAWVESTSTANTYVEVAKNTIPDPLTYASAKTFLRMARQTATVSADKADLKVGETANVTASVSGINLSSGTWSSSNTAVATVSGTGASASIKAVGAGTAQISFKATVNGVSGNNGSTEYIGACTVTVTSAAGTITVEPSAVSVGIGAQVSAKAGAFGYTAGQALNYSVASDRPDIAAASVDTAGNITVKGVAIGDAVVTVTVNYNGGDASTASSASLNVKVTGAKAITLDKTTATVYLTAPVTINAVIANAVTQNNVTAESSDTNVATVAVNGRAVTVTGVNPGSATITVKYTENGEEIKATCAVTVKSHPKDDKANKLKDSQGQQLFVEENGNYREAVYADYYTASKFFIKGVAKYTGWQTIDGKVYFFDGAGNKVTGEQVIQGAKYNFASDGSLVVGSGTMGIDVSKWNGTIDWNAVKNSGVSYVIIRCGYRGSSAGGLIDDPKYEANIKGATGAGLKVGVYFFTQAINEQEAVAEASMVLDRVKKYKISYPIFLDVESSGGRGDKIDKATRTAVCKAFCKTIQDAGYTAGIYANKTWLETKIDASALSAYKIWLAQYAAAPTYKGKYDLWQYKSTGRVSGISGNVDLNLSYLGY